MRQVVLWMPVVLLVLLGAAAQPAHAQKKELQRAEETQQLAAEFQMAAEYNNSNYYYLEAARLFDMVLEGELRRRMLERKGEIYLQYFECIRQVARNYAFAGYPARAELLLRQNLIRVRAQASAGVAAYMPLHLWAMGDVWAERDSFLRADDLYVQAAAALNRPDPDMRVALAAARARCRLAMAQYQVAKSTLDAEGEEAKKLESKPTPQLARYYERYGELYLAQGLDSLAVGFLRKSAQARRACAAPPNEQAAGLYFLGYLLQRAGKPDSSVILYEQALALVDKRAAPPGSDRLRLLYALGVVWLDKEDPHRALDYLKQAADLCASLQHPRYVRLDDIYYQMGEAFFKKKEWDAALQQTKMAWQSAQSSRTLTDEDQLRFCSAFARIYNGLGDFDAAIRWQEQALGYATLRFGERDLRTGAYYRQMAQYHLARGHYDLALGLFEQDLAILRQQPQPSRRAILDAVLNIGTLYNYEGKYARALEFLEEALRGYLEATGEESKEVASCYLQLGAAYYGRMDYEAARNYFEQAYRIARARYARVSPEIAEIQYHQGLARLALGNQNKAEDEFNHALLTYKAVYGFKHPDYARVQAQVGFCYAMRGLYLRAGTELGRALATQEEKLGPEHQDLALTHQLMALTFWLDGKYRPALRHALRGAVIRRRVWGHTHPLVDQSNKLVAICLSACVTRLFLAGY